MRWLMDFYCYCVYWTLDWLFGSSAVCTDTLTREGDMELKWYLVHRKWVSRVSTEYTVYESDDPIDAVLARNENEAETITERRHGWRSNEWPRAHLASQWNAEKFAVILNDAVTKRIEEFEEFMRLERVARASKEV